MRRVQLIGLGYLVGIACFALGLYVAHTRAWPFPILRDIYRFVQGHTDEATSVFEKISNDAGIRPERFLYDYTPADPTGFRALDALPVAERRAAPLIRADGGAPEGYVYVVGKFDLETAMNAVLLFSTDGRLVKHWTIPDREIKDGHHHLFDMRRDGSFVSAADYADLYHIDRCGDEIGRIPGLFHHSIAPIDATRYWVTGGPEERDAISIIDIAGHDVERTIPLEAIHDAADPELSIFEVGVGGKDPEDPWHNNDVDPLPADLAGATPFEAGDLLVSYRHVNLVYVVDPDTLEIKWWSNDYLSGQHDPDWQPDGTVTVYDNRSLGKPGRYSAIQRFDLDGGPPEMTLDGRDTGFYSGIGGKHRIFEDGSIMALSYEQGRVLWLGPEGETWFEFVNRYSEGESLALLNSGYLPADYFEQEVTAPCG